MVQEGSFPPAWETENQRVLIPLEEFLYGNRLLVESRKMERLTLSSCANVYSASTSFASELTKIRFG
jgi:hypothetical protein